MGETDDTRGSDFGGRPEFVAIDPHEAGRAIIGEALTSLAYAVDRIDMPSEAIDDAVRLNQTMVKEQKPEREAAHSLGIKLTVPITAALLALYVMGWETGGEHAALRLTNTVEIDELAPEGDDRGLLHWIFLAADALYWFQPSSTEEEEDPLDTSAAKAARQFRRLARVLRAAKANDEALACAMSAVNLALWSEEALASIELALELVAASGDPAVALRLKARQAQVLTLRSAGRPRLAVAAFDAIESVVRQVGDVPMHREEILAMLTAVVDRSHHMRGIRPLLLAATGSPTGEPDFDRPALILSSARWDLTWEQFAELTDSFSFLAIALENQRRALEPLEQATGAEARWATWSFEYPPFRRALPHGPSLRREADLDELFLIVAHETIHVLSMFSALGRAVSALRLALLEIEFRLWTYLGPADPEALSSAGVAPLDKGSVAALAQAEAALEISRKLQILQDVWGPWLEGLAVFGEIGADAPQDPMGSPVAEVLMNLIEEGPVAQMAAAEGTTVQAVVERRRADAERIFQAAGQRQGAARLRRMLATNPEKYLAGYLAIRGVIASWRSRCANEVDAQVAFRALLHVTRFGSVDAIPDLALSCGDFREHALAKLRDWVLQVARMDCEDLDRFRAPSGEPTEWLEGKLVAHRLTRAQRAEAARERLIGGCSRALHTLAGPHANLDRVLDGDGETRILLEAAANALMQHRFSLADPDAADPGIVDRMSARIAVMPIGHVRSPFWLLAPVGRLVVLLRTTEESVAVDGARHQLLAVKLAPDETEELEREMRARRDSRMLVARVADVQELTKPEERRNLGANYIVYSYGDWLHIQRGGIFEGTPPVSEALAELARERLTPDPVLDFESDLTAEGRAGAERTARWLEHVDGWREGGYKYDARAWAAHVHALANDVLDRETHREGAEASDVLLETVLGPGDWSALRDQGLELLRARAPTWIGEVAQQLVANSSGPTESSFLSDHADEVNQILGPVFADCGGAWDVTAILKED
jgi:hypothetical protein